MELKDLEQEAKELIDVSVILDDDGTPISGFKVLGSDSPEYQEADHAWKVKNVQKSARRGHAIQAATETGASELVNLVQKREMAICVACVKEVYGFTEGGVAVPTSEETLKKLFAKKPTWRSKIVMAIEAEQVFTKPSSAAGGN